MTDTSLEGRELSSRYVFWLWGLVIVFSGRGIAQLSQFIFDVSFLPPFESWYSGAVAYPRLLLSQVLIIMAMVIVTWKISNDALKTRKLLGIFLLAIGSIYFLAMAGRLVFCFTSLSEVVWFNRPIPSFFHIVLSTYILLLGHYYLLMSRQKKEQ